MWSCCAPIFISKTCGILAELQYTQKRRGKTDYLPPIYMQNRSEMENLYMPILTSSFFHFLSNFTSDYFNAQRYPLAAYARFKLAFMRNSAGGYFKTLKKSTSFSLRTCLWRAPKVEKIWWTQKKIQNFFRPESPKKCFWSIPHTGSTRTGPHRCAN